MAAAFRRRKTRSSGPCERQREATRARRQIPLALFLAVIIGGLFLTFGLYAATIGFGVHHSSALAGNAAPARPWPASDRAG
jgi:hypothetical protein